MCVHACVRACVRGCVCVWVCVCVISLASSTSERRRTGSTSKTPDPNTSIADAPILPLKPFIGRALGRPCGPTHPYYRLQRPARRRISEERRSSGRAWRRRVEALGGTRGPSPLSFLVFVFLLHSLLWVFSPFLFSFLMRLYIFPDVSRCTRNGLAKVCVCIPLYGKHLIVTHTRLCWAYGPTTVYTQLLYGRPMSGVKLRGTALYSCNHSVCCGAVSPQLKHGST